jgi:hypothetical protein
MALMMVGEENIRSLDEPNNRAGLCQTLYPIVRDAILSVSDWSFARKTVLLQRLATDLVEGPTYQIPSDCLTPLSIWPRGQIRIQFKIAGDKIIIPVYNVVGTATALTASRYLQYTRRETDTVLFSSSFVDLVALDLATRLAMPLANDLKLASALRQDLKFLRLEAEAEDANRGDDYRNADEDPENDTFVNPLGSSRTTEYIGGVGWVSTS